MAETKQDLQDLLHAISVDFDALGPFEASYGADDGDEKAVDDRKITETFFDPPTEMMNFWDSLNRTQPLTINMPPIGWDILIRCLRGTVDSDYMLGKLAFAIGRRDQQSVDKEFRAFVEQMNRRSHLLNQFVAVLIASVPADGDARDER